MAPVSFAIQGDPVTRVPVASDVFWIGRDTACDLCVWDLRVSRRHAKVSLVMGEHVLAAEGKHGIHVNGKRVPVINLRDGDVVDLTPPDVHAPVRLTFENALEGIFLPPDVPRTSVWLASDRSRPAGPHALGRYDVVDADDGIRAGQSYAAVERGGDRRIEIDVFAPVERSAAEGDRFLRLAAAIGGASHPALARVLDAGITPVRSGPGAEFLRWVALEVPDGRLAARRIEEGPQSAITVVRRLRALAGALHLLHERGVVHGSVHPENVVLKPDGRAALRGFHRAWTLREGPLHVEPGPRRAGAAWTAPEIVAGGTGSPPADLFGLAALGYGLLTGAPPPTVPSPPAASEAGAVVPGAVDHLLLRGLAADPTERPLALDFVQVLAFAESSLRGSPE